MSTRAQVLNVSNKFQMKTMQEPKKSSYYPRTSQPNFLSVGFLDGCF